MGREGICLVQKRQLFLASNDLRGRLSDEVAKGSGKVCLIKIAGQMDHVENGGALLQQVCRVPCSFDLTISSAGDAGGPQKMPLCGP